MPGDGDIVEEEVAVRAAADGEDVGVETDGLPLSPPPERMSSTVPAACGSRRRPASSRSATE